MAKLPRQVTTSAAASSRSSRPATRRDSKIGTSDAGLGTFRSRSRKVAWPSERSKGTDGWTYRLSRERS